MQFRKPHPWDGQYALPDNVMAEPPGRGTLTTAYLRRRSFPPVDVVQPWQNRYAVPEYVKAEPIGRGVFRSKGLRRRTVDTLVPEYLGGLGADPAPAAGDAVAQYGRRAAALMLKGARQAPKNQRKLALRMMMDSIDKNLWGTVADKAHQLQQERGLPPAIAVEQALAASLANGLVGEMRGFGRKRGPLALGADGSSTSPWDFTDFKVETRDHRKSRNMFNQPRFQEAFKFAMDTAWGKGNRRMANMIETGQLPFATFINVSDNKRKWGVYWNQDTHVLQVKPVPPRKTSLFSSVWGFIKSIGQGFTSLPRVLRTAGNQVVQTAKDVLDKVGDMACGVVSSSAGQTAITAAATAKGGPQAGAIASQGTQVAAQVCNPQKPPEPPAPPAAAEQSSMLVPIAIAGAAGVAAFFLLG